MNQNDINRAFTEKVAELLGRGYQIYPGTMGGSQGEIAHVDLYRGDEIIRVLLDHSTGRGEKPDGYCKVAVAARKALSDRELFEIEGKLVFTDDLEAYLEGGDRTAFCADEFDSHAAFEKWLLNAVAEWCRNDPLMVDSLDQYL